MPVQLIISEGAMKTSFNGQLVDDKEYKAVYDGKEGWVDELDLTEPEDIPGSDWKSTWDDYDPWDAYPQVSGEIWEPEYLGDR